MSFKIVRWLHKKGLSRKKLRGGRIHRYFGDRVLHSNFWEFNPQSIARAWFVSIFSAASPFLGLHMLISIGGALLIGANLPISAALVWINNPFTMIVYYPIAYWFGCKITHHEFMPHIDWHYALTHGWETFRLLFVQIWEPLLIGCIVIGMIFGVLGYAAILFFAKIHQTIKKRKK